MGIGQGYTNLNALQLCVQASRIANGRKAVLPKLVKSINGVDQIANEKLDDLPFNPANMDFVKAAMQAVVTDPRGTAAGAAKLGLGEVAMAGKTGTAQAHGYGGGIGQHGSTGAWKGRDHAWFIAFAPADKPKYACSVIVEHGGFGAHSAAPIAREIMRVALLKDPEIRKRIVGPIEDTKDFSDTDVTHDPDAAAAQDTSVTAPPPGADTGSSSDGDDTSE
jgi:penicillin-binding protein 2